KELGLNNEIMRSLEDLGFLDPYPIQEKVIPFIIESRQDLIALAQTGTGKTAAFGLPILNQIPQGHFLRGVKGNDRDLTAIILCPTRELCLQIADDMKKYAKYSSGVNITPVFGGAKIEFQIQALRRGTNIVVGTPGRVHDLIRRKILRLQKIKWLVLDEADEMLDMGFKDDLDAILTETPKTRQTLLFSATMSRSVSVIAQKYMKDAQEISAGEKNIGAAKVSHEYYVVQLRDRFEALKRILDCIPNVYGILFCRTRRETQDIADKLKQAGYDTEALHGEISQVMRTKIMDRFKRKQVHLLVATDVAARGIDVSDLTHVINYNLPAQNEAYTHRSGRTGRAEKSGICVSLFTPRDVRRVRELEGIIGKKFEYKQVPNGEEIGLKQIANFLKELESAVSKTVANKKYFDDFSDRLSKFKKEDLIKLFFNHQFSHLVDGQINARDLNSNAKTASDKKRSVEHINLKINLGKRFGFDVKGLFNIINSCKILKGIEIGQISLMSEFSIFSVEKRRADKVIESLDGTRFKGQGISIEKSGMKVEYNRHSPLRRDFDATGRKRGNRSNRGFNKRKGRGRYAKRK
ncbi:MAG: DEAD/DEAH box helicase, partial [Candidatus Omnitrophota bacterium]